MTSLSTTRSEPAWPRGGPTLDDLISDPLVVGFVGPLGMPDGTQAAVLTRLSTPMVSPTTPGTVELAIDGPAGWAIQQAIEVNNPAAPVMTGDLDGDGRSEIVVSLGTTDGSYRWDALFRLDGEIERARVRRPRRRVLQAVEDTGDRVLEQPRLVDDLGGGRVVERDPGHLDHPHRRVGAGGIGLAAAAGDEPRGRVHGLIGASLAGGAAVVDVHDRRVVRVVDEPVRVRPAARLDAADLHRVVEVGDVPDAHAAEAALLGTGRVALGAAVDPAGAS